MRRLNSNWLAVLLYGFGVIISIYFLRENQYNYLTDSSDQRIEYYSTLLFIAGVFQMGLFSLWFVNYIRKTHLSYYLLSLLVALTAIFLYLWERSYGDPSFLKLMFSWLEIMHCCHITRPSSIASKLAGPRSARPLTAGVRSIKHHYSTIIVYTNKALTAT